MSISEVWRQTFNIILDCKQSACSQLVAAGGGADQQQQMTSLNQLLWMSCSSNFYFSLFLSPPRDQLSKSSKVGKYLLPKFPISPPPFSTITKYNGNTNEDHTPCRRRSRDWFSFSFFPGTRKSAENLAETVWQL